MSQIACEMTADYLSNLRELGVNQIDYLPRATDHMPQSISFIKALEDKDYAYAVDGDVFFDVAKDGNYGQLSNRSMESQQGEGGEVFVRNDLDGTSIRARVVRESWQILRRRKGSWPHA